MVDIGGGRCLARCVVAGVEAKVRRSLFQRSYYSLGRSLLSLVPRPHPVMKRNDLVNQVKFIGHTFVTVSPSNVPNFLRITFPWGSGGMPPDSPSRYARFHMLPSSRYHPVSPNSKSYMKPCLI